MTPGAKKKVITKSVVTAVVLVLVIVLSLLCNTYAVYLDQFLGRGAQKVTESSGLTGDYINFQFSDNYSARDNAAAVTQKVAEEGMVLLRNDNNALPVADTTKITILGYYAWHNNMAGGEDPSTVENAISLGLGLENKFDTNDAVTAIYASTNGDFADPEAAFGGVEDTFDEYNTAVIVFKRNSGEGNDQVRVQNDNGVQRTGLSITTAEYKLIDYASKHFDSVIIVINAANTMELAWLDPNDAGYDANGNYTDPYTGTKYDFSGIKAAIWAGCCGSQGGTALANIISGVVNPSGHTSDIYARVLANDPTFVNFGNFEYTNGRSLDTYQGASVYFVEYEEGIYSGYRYYETAAYEASKGNYDGYKYEDAVVYPFGYGMSYTTFDMAYEGEPTFDAATETYTFKVKVTNTGSVAGKAVAQIYVSQPYEKGQVEKSHVQLIGFDKTEVLAPGATETLTITASRDYFSSFDYITEKAYVLDAGDYKFYLSENSHSWASIADTDTDKCWIQTVDSKIVYNENGAGKRTTDLIVATNVMDDETNYKFKAWDEGSDGDGFIHTMSRENFKESFPDAPEGQDLVITDERAIRAIEIYDVWAEDQNPITEMPEVNTDETSYTLIEMRGVPFDDPKWDDYINQFTVESMAYMFSNGGWNEMADTDNGVPISYDCDSPYGFYGFQLKVSSYPHNIWYCGAPMVSATFNLDLATELGHAFAEEAWNFKQDDGQPITGLYGYGLNMHRSAFGGRNYEYYSEDPVLAGKFAATEAAAASEKGLITFMKHYTLNDQETNRQNNGYCAWADEQTFREVYLRGWEIYMKEAKMEVNYYGVNEDGEYEMMTTTMPAATGIMTCYNRIGAIFGGASVTINACLRNEFGFTGTVLTDAGGEPNTYMTTDLSLRAGQNLTLANNGTNGLYDTESPTAIYWLKESTHHLLYNKANSNCVMGLTPGAIISYETSPWVYALYAIWAVTALFVAFNVYQIIGISSGKIKVKEKAVAADDDEY